VDAGHSSQVTSLGFVGTLKLLVADVSGDQLEAIKAGRLHLPLAWELSGNII